MPKAIDLTGRRFGKLLVTGPCESVLLSGRKRRIWTCQCDCGETTKTEAGNLVTGNSTACRCGRFKTHGAHKTPTYRIWANVLSRCRNPNDDGWEHYGGRGITVCDRWLAFENFLADMGERPAGMSIDRIHNDGNYEPSNCRWATPKQQAQNRRDNVLSLEKAAEIRRLSAAGITKAEIARQFGVSFPAVARVVDGTRWVSP